MNPADNIAFWADQLRDIAANGLMYSENKYDIENYKKISEISMRMLALATGDSLEKIKKLTAPIYSRPTPLVVADAAIINGKAQILLIQRADNQLWAMPGGALNVGETPAEGVIRETLEETGIECTVSLLVGVYDSRLCGSVTRHHQYHFTFLCQPFREDVTHQAEFSNEILNARWFDENDLPESIDPGHITRIPRAYEAWHGNLRTFFD